VKLRLLIADDVARCFAGCGDGPAKHRTNLCGRRLLEHESDCGHAQMETGPGQDLGNFHLPRHRTKGLQPLDHVSHEVGMLVHRLGQLDQGLCALFGDAIQPGGNGFRRQQERLGRLLQGPATGRSELKDTGAAQVREAVLPC
jgi:hypothetical protein